MPRLIPLETYSKQVKNLLRRGVLSDRLYAQFIKLIGEDPRHSSLHSKPIRHAKGIWEASVTMDIRVTWQWHTEEENSIILRVIGDHDDTIKAASTTPIYGLPQFL